MHYDLCLIWYWEYDTDFVAAIQAACSTEDVSLLLVSPENLVQATTDLLEGRVAMSVLLDRAQYHAGFSPLLQKAREQGVYCINSRERSSWAEDKATMHLELISHGLETPYTLILAPFIEQPILPPLDLSPLGEQFVIKPAIGGGSEGVTMHATSLEQVLQARAEYADQKYLVQAYIEPQELNGRKAWFRVYFVDGTIYPCWWDPETHRFAPLQADDELRFGLSPLRLVTATIASICRLDWFSTEIAFSKDGKFVAVDYVNDGIDLRSQSKAQDGVPDEVVKAMAEDLVTLARRQQKVAPLD
jgi:hypothetical protein